MSILTDAVPGVAVAPRPRAQLRLVFFLAQTSLRHTHDSRHSRRRQRNSIPSYGLRAAQSGRRWCSSPTGRGLVLGVLVAVASDGSKRAAETCSGTRMQTSGGFAVPRGMSLGRDAAASVRQRVWVCERATEPWKVAFVVSGSELRSLGSSRGERSASPASGHRPNNRAGYSVMHRPQCARERIDGSKFTWWGCS